MDGYAFSSLLHLSLTHSLNHSLTHTLTHFHTHALTHTMLEDHGKSLHSFVLQLEGGAWESKRVVERARTKNGPLALGRLVSKVSE